MEYFKDATFSKFISYMDKILIYSLVGLLIGLNKLTLKCIVKTKLLKLVKTFAKKDEEGIKWRRGLLYKI